MVGDQVFLQLHSGEALKTRANAAVFALESLAISLDGAIKEIELAAVMPYDWKSPADIMAEFLSEGFSAILSLLEEMKYVDPDAEILTFGGRIVSALTQIGSLTKKYAIK